MNCLEFRRLCLSEPSTRTEEYLAHRDECDECRRFAEGVGVLDQKLLQAMQVPVPQDIATRIKLRQVIGDEERKRRVRPWQFALAASLVLSVTISGFFGYRLYTTNQYVDGLRVAMLEHVKEEPHFLAAADEVSPAKFQKIIAAFGGEVTQKVATVMTAEVCALKRNNQPVAHAVLKGEKGAVTVLYLNGERIKNNVAIDDDRFQGVLMPAGNGNMAVIGEAGEPLEPMVEKLKTSIFWKI